MAAEKKVNGRISPERFPETRWHNSFRFESFQRLWPNRNQADPLDRSIHRIRCDRQILSLHRIFPRVYPIGRDGYKQTAGCVTDDQQTGMRLWLQSQTTENVKIYLII